MLIKLLVLSPKETIFEDFVRSVSLPGVEGPFQVLSGHAPLMSQLDVGEVLIDTEDVGQQSFVVQGGFVEVQKNKVTVLTTASSAS